MDIRAPWYTWFFTRGHLLLLSIVIITVAGVSAIKNLPRLEDPRIDLRNVLIFTQYPGASAERVEALVSDVLEDELRQLHEIKEIKSTSKAGFSMLQVELEDWTDNSINQQVFAKIRDGAELAYAAFPEGAHKPYVEDKRGATSFTLLIAVKSAFDKQPNSVSSRLASELADSLRNVNGTELVRIYGQNPEEIEVAIDPHKLASVGLSLAELRQRVANADAKLPAGTMRGKTNDFRLQVSQPLRSVAAIEQIPLAAKAQAYLTVGDIATVTQSMRQPLLAHVLVDGQSSIIIAARMQTSLRIDQWTADIEAKLASFIQQYAASVDATVVFKQNQYTDQRLSDLRDNLVLGSLVVVLVILVFMGAKASLIVGAALPMCAAFAIFSLSFFNQQIHQMSIFGIIIAVGLLIDNAIVITDEIRINLLNPSLSRLQAMQKSVQHLAAPLFASTMTTVLGFMPIFLLNGNIGDFISPIAISVVMALIGSLFISLTIIAALAARYLPRDQQQSKPWYWQGLQLPQLSQSFSHVLRHLMAMPKRVCLLIAVLCLSGFALSSQLANVFFPSADRDQFEIYIFLPKSSSIEQTAKRTSDIDQFIRANAETKQVMWRIGGSFPSVYYNQVMTRDNSPEFANAVVTTLSQTASANLLSDLQLDLQAAFPDVKVIVRPFGQGPPIPAPIEIDVFGPDIDVLIALGEQMRLAMTQIPGITQSTLSIDRSEPELVFDISEMESYLSGLGASDIARQLLYNLNGATGGSVLQASEEMPIRMRLASGKRDQVDALEAIPLINAQLREAGLSLGIGAMASAELVASVSAITRINGERVNKVQAYLLPNVPAITVSQQLRELIDQSDMSLPPGYRLKMAGDADKQQEALGQLSTYLPVLLVLMLTTLILTFSSFRFAAVIGSVAVLSVGLGMFSLWLSGLPIGFNPLLGCAGLIGVAINGSIVVIAAIKSNPAAISGDCDAILHETMGCSRHILSTTLTTVGGLLPLLLFSSGTFWPPLAVVLAGGVGFSIILSLVYTPVLMTYLCQARASTQRSEKTLVTE